MRPAELATDYTTSFQLNEHFLQDFSDEQVFVLLQVTSPLRTGKHVREAIELYDLGQADHVVSFTKLTSHQLYLQAWMNLVLLKILQD